MTRPAAVWERGGVNVYNLHMLPELQLKDIVRMRKPHPCGSYEWTVTRLGADIGLQCNGCGRRIMLTRRELSRRSKQIVRQEGEGSGDSNAKTSYPHPVL